MVQQLCVGVEFDTGWDLSELKGTLALGEGIHSTEWQSSVKFLLIMHQAVLDVTTISCCNHIILLGVDIIISVYNT